jgi:hypothetical protein
MATPKSQLLNSTYHKIRDILTVLISLPDPSLADLVAAIHLSDPDSFCYWAPRTSSGDRRTSCSLVAIRRAIRTSELLGLLIIESQGDQCRLTDDGRDALKPDRFDATLANSALRRLGELGYGREALLGEMRRIQLPEVPDLPTLYAKRPATATALRKTHFEKLMSLTAESGAFRVQRAQLFFVPSSASG